MTIGPSDRTMQLERCAAQARSRLRRWISALFGLVLLLAPGIATADIHFVHGAPDRIAASDLDQACDADGATAKHDAHRGCLGGTGCTLGAMLCDEVPPLQMPRLFLGRLPSTAPAGQDITPLFHPPKPVQL